MAHYAEWEAVPPGDDNRRLIRFIGDGRGHRRTIGQAEKWIDGGGMHPATFFNYLDSLITLGYLEPVVSDPLGRLAGWTLSGTGLKAYEAILNGDKE